MRDDKQALKKRFSAMEAKKVRKLLTNALDAYTDDTINLFLDVIPEDDIYKKFLNWVIKSDISIEDGHAFNRFIDETVAGRTIEIIKRRSKQDADKIVYHARIMKDGGMTTFGDSPYDVLKSLIPPFHIRVTEIDET